MGETPISSTGLPDAFSLDDRQGVIYERLERLVGQNAASFYKDACRVMSPASSFEATTNIVAHLLREIESAIRDVLDPMVFGGDSASKDESEIFTSYLKLKGKLKEYFKDVFKILCIQSPVIESHKDRIEKIAKSLDLPSDATEAWVKLPGKNGLHRYAHRSGLAPVRPVDKDFEEMWYRLEIVLDAVLNRFEAQYGKIFSKLDELAQKENPTVSDKGIFCSNVSNHYIVHAHFFNQLTNPKWLSLLREEAVFKSTPNLESVMMADGSIGVRRRPWPLAVYLEKMALVNPTEVENILKKIKYFDNPDIKAALLSIVANLPRDCRVRLLSDIKKWMRTDQRFWQSLMVDPIIKVINKFVEDNDEENAFALTEIFLEVIPDPQEKNSQDDDGHQAKLKPTSRTESFSYKEFIKGDFSGLFNLNPRRAFELLCSLLFAYRSLKYSNQKKEDSEDIQDYSYISRPAIEDHEQNHEHEQIDDILISGIRDSAIKILQTSPQSLPKIVNFLESKEWNIFKRIAIFLMSEFPAADEDLVGAYIIKNKHLIDDFDFKHEFAQLLRKGFSILNDGQKKLILSWIGKAESIQKRVKEASESHSNEDLVKYTEIWQRDCLSYIVDRLDSDWKKKYSDLVAKHGEPEHPDLSSVITSWSGPLSETSTDDLLKMSDGDLIIYLKSWEPKTNTHFGPTKEGLGRELQKAIKATPERFINLSKNFKGLDPTYVRSYMQAFRELVSSSPVIDWELLLNLCSWVSEQPLSIPDRKGGIMDQDPDWDWTKKSIAGLISDGMNKNLIPFRLKGRVFGILKKLSADPDSASDDEADRNPEDAYTIAINSTRGETMVAIIEYSLWVYRNLKKTIEKGELGKGFDNLPEVKEILEDCLKNNSSIAVRAVIGRFFPWILLIDEKWVTAHLEEIFPKGKFEDRLYAAAWNTLILYVPLYNQSFHALKGKYLEAINNLGKAEKGRGKITDRDERLAEHLMLTYGSGQIDISDERLQNFWKIANDDLRGHTMEFIGRSLKNEDVPKEAVERFKKLWESRARFILEEGDRARYQKEMAAFGWWFASDKIAEDWGFKQYLNALDTGSEASYHEYVVIDRLSDLAHSYPLNAVNVLSKLLDKKNENLTVLGSKEKIESIITEVIKSSDDKAKKEAKDLINRLISRGYSFETLRDLAR